MSTTDTRAAFEAAKAKMIDGWTDFDMFEAGHKSATEAAKATGTAGEQEPVACVWVERYMTQVKFGKVMSQKIIEAGGLERSLNLYLSSEAARQPAPVVAVKTWQERRIDFMKDGAFLHPEDAKDAEIADLRAALAATNRSKP